MQKYFLNQVEEAISITYYSPMVNKYGNDTHEHSEK